MSQALCPGDQAIVFGSEAGRREGLLGCGRCAPAADDDDKQVS